MNEAMVDEESGLCNNADGNCGSVLAIPYFLCFQASAAHTASSPSWAARLPPAVLPLLHSHASFVGLPP